LLAPERSQGRTGAIPGVRVAQRCVWLFCKNTLRFMEIAKRSSKSRSYTNAVVYFAPEPSN
jgi:hypothetical protein